MHTQKQQCTHKNSNAHTKTAMHTQNGYEHTKTTISTQKQQCTHKNSNEYTKQQCTYKNRNWHTKQQWTHKNSNAHTNTAMNTQKQQCTHKTAMNTQKQQCTQKHSYEHTKTAMHKQAQLWTHINELRLNLLLPINTENLIFDTNKSFTLYLLLRINNDAHLTECCVLLLRTPTKSFLFLSQNFWWSKRRRPRSGRHNAVWLTTILPR